jgi:DNA polymerase beta
MSSRPILKLKLKLKSQETHTSSMHQIINLREYHMKAQAEHTQSTLNFKQLVIDQLTLLTTKTEYAYEHESDLVEKKRQQFRLTQFKRAVDALRKWPKVLIDGITAKLEIAGIGDGIAKRIDEIKRTGTLAELGNGALPMPTPKSEKTRIIDELLTVTGIGEVHATKYAEAGVTGVYDLISKVTTGAIKVTHHTQIGLKYYEDFKQRIPYAEVADITQNMKRSIMKLPYASKLLVEICGSFRRERPDSGDIDMLITHKDLISYEDLSKDSTEYLKQIVQQLHSSGILIDDLTSQGHTKYMGVCQGKSIQCSHRVDIRFVTYDAYFPALLYFTGSMELNKYMRTIALERGFTLNEYGLYQYDIQTQTKGNRLTANSEEDIFQLLGIEYLAPNQREF